MPELFQRVPSLRAFDHGDSTTVLSHDGSARAFQGEDALIIRELVRYLSHPRSLEEIFSHLEKLVPTEDARSLIDEALQHLQDAGAVVLRETASPAPKPSEGHRIVLGVTGALSASHTPMLVEQLQRRGFEVRVALTKAARRFVQPDVLKVLTRHHVYGGLWSRSTREPVPYAALAEWAEVVLLAPAAATTLARIVQGDCSDIVSTLALAARVPVVIAPTMNANLSEAPAIARNIEQLARDGFHVLPPASSVSASDLVAVVEHLLAPPTPPGEAPLNAEEISNAWEMAYQSTPPDRLPFHSDRLDKDLRDVLERVKRPATLWDVGTGLGTVAKEAARLGFTATGTDISPRAVELARERSQGRAQFQVDDVRDSKLTGEFDVVVDRGCFHTLEAAAIGSYVEAIRQRTHPGSLLILKIHREDEPGDWRTHRYRQEDLQKVFRPWFEMVRWSESTMLGRVDPPAHAWLAVLERREPPAA